MDHSTANTPHLRNLSTQKISFLFETSIVGRHADCDIVLVGERGASRKHARLTLENSAVYIMDLGSLNGTLVNDVEIDQRVELKHKDKLVFDEQEYEIVIPPVQETQPSNAETVVVNKEEALNRERIKPAIRTVVEEDNLTADTTALLDANKNGAVQAKPKDDFESMPIAATSRPGGDAMPSKKRLAQNSFQQSPWKRWYVWAPLLVLLLLIGLFFAYKAGQLASAPNGLISNDS